MFDQLKFCQGAVSKKNLLPVLNHYMIRNKRITSYNGEIALSTPVPLEMTCFPNADKFYKAIGQCQAGTNVELNLTDSGNLRIRNGKFRAIVTCLTEEKGIDIEPEGEQYELDGEALFHALKTIEPFIGNDASRAWSNGALFRDCCVVATTNAILIQQWVKKSILPEVNLPGITIREFLRIKRIPTGVMFAKHSITFLYEDKSWLKSHLLATKWPNLEEVMKTDGTEKPMPLPRDFFVGLKSIADFVDPQFKKIYFRDNSIATHEDEQGAVYTFDEPFPYKGVYNVEMLQKLEGVVETIDFSAFPKKALFYGSEHIRGFMVGMRL